MNMRFIEFLAACALTFAAIFSFAKGAFAGDIMVMQAVAAKSLTPQAQTGAVYFVLMNHGPEPDALTAVASTAAEVAELHQSRDDNGIMRMDKVERLELASGATLDLGAAGYHVMLMGLKHPLKPGERVRLTLTFEKAGDISIDAPVSDKPGAGHVH